MGEYAVPKIVVITYYVTRTVLYNYVKEVFFLNRLQDFISIINSKLGTGYVYGGQSDQPLTREVLDVFVKKYGRTHYYFLNYSAERWLGKQYYDCSGLVVYTLTKMGLIPKGVDYSAQSLYTQLCRPLQRAQLRQGDLCFNKTAEGIVHVGVYMGNNKVTHARGTFYGVVNTILFDSFNTFGRLKYFEDVEPEVKVTIEKSQKRAITGANIYGKMNIQSAVISTVEKGNIIDIEGKTDNGWYLVKYNNLSGYVRKADVEDYDELFEVMQFLSDKSGIGRDQWYKTAKEVKWLDICFTKIAKGFGFKN